MITTESLDPKDGDAERNPKSIIELEIEEVKLFRDIDPKTVRTGRNLLNDFKDELIRLLEKYHKCFAWTTVDMLGIDLEVAYHKLAINLNVKPIQ